MAPIPDLTPRPYHTWREVETAVLGSTLTVATKPGVFAHGREDTAALLLAGQVETRTGDTVVQMNCGSGVFGAVARRLSPGGRLFLTDRNIVSCAAAIRTVALNDLANVEVCPGHGAQALPSDLVADVVAIRIPQDRLSVVKLVGDAFRNLRVGGRCYLAGATNEGVKSAAKILERVFGNAVVLAHGGGHRVVAAEKRDETLAGGEATDDPLLRDDTFHELDATLRGVPLKLYSRPGVFSWDHVDEATQILADHIEISARAAVLDLGCGYGGLGVLAGKLAPEGRVCMADADTEAVRSATRTAEAAGLEDYRVLASDVAGAVLEERFDTVITNPPFHVGKATDLDVPLQFIEDAWRVLSPGGRLFLVANRTLPYELAIRRRFGNQVTLHDGRRFKVLAATRGNEGA